MTTSPTGAETQIWISSSSVEESSPVERFFTLPAVFRQEQVWQIPIRQPNSGAEPGGLGLLEYGRAAVVHPEVGAGEVQ